MDSQASAIGTLLLVKAKCSDATASDITNVEYQAFMAACAYHFATGLQNIWAMTCVASAARFWIFSSDSVFLIPFVPEGPSEAERSSYYLEISTNGADILEALDYVKAHPSPPA